MIEGRRIPGTHNMQVQELSAQTLAEFNKLKVKQKVRLKALEKEENWKADDLNDFGMPIQYTILFRGQTKEYIDAKTGKPSLLPTGLRGEPLNRDEVIPKSEKLQTAWRNYLLWLVERAIGKELWKCLTELATKSNLAKNIESPEERLYWGLWSWAPYLEGYLDDIFLHSEIKKAHKCALAEVAVPSFERFRNDIKKYHQNLPVSIFNVISAYVGWFLYENTFMDPPGIWSMLAVAQHYGLRTYCLDVTVDPLIALWFATHKQNRYNKTVKFVPHEESGVVYVFFVPKAERWFVSKPPAVAETGLYAGVHGVRGAPELRFYVDLSHVITTVWYDRSTRPTRQKAAMLTGLSMFPWPHNAYSEFLSAKIIVKPNLGNDEAWKRHLNRLKTKWLFPGPEKDRLHSALLDATILDLLAYE